MDRPRKDYFDALVAIAITLIGLYPLYRDDLARWKLWAEQKFSRRDNYRDALEQVQREISLMEHGQ